MARLKGFEKLTNIDEAFSALIGKLEPKSLRSERIPIRTALRRVTAEKILARNDLPPFDRSAVDGYALKAQNTFEASQFNSRTLKLTENEEIHEGEAKQIWTGNSLPRGADAVVMLEHTRKTRDLIEVGITVTPGGNVVKKGEDVKKGEVAVEARTRLKPHHLGLLAALGATDVAVVLKPTAAILSTGNELVELGNKSRPNQIVETNRLIFFSLCQELGAEPLDLGIAKDDLEEISTRIREGLELADLVVATGGTSVGYADLVPMAVNQIGPPGVIVHGVAMRPGMPTALAIIQGKPVFILPGNPVAAMVGFEVFVRPFLLMLLGVEWESRPTLQARLTRRVTSALGRRVFLRVRVFERNGEFFAEPVRIKGSSVFSTMTKANGYLEIPEKREGLDEGEFVYVHLFDRIEGTKHV